MRKVVMAAALCLLVAADEPQEAAKKELAKMQGEWSMVSGERDGQEFGKDIVDGAKRMVKGDQVTITVNEQVFLKARITIDPTKKPRTIDYTPTEGDNKGQTMKGIYELTGDTAKFCTAQPGAERPTDFTAKEGSGRTLSVWKKVGK
jgi:uncharacterized protein (TIGR03067 family)